MLSSQGSTVLKLVFFALLIVAVCAMNTWVINGPMMQHNTAISVGQLNNNVPATAGDIQVFGYWMSYNTLYVVEAILVALVGCFLFLGNITRWFAGE